jgi:hypothetical protein
MSSMHNQRCVCHRTQRCLRGERALELTPETTDPALLEAVTETPVAAQVLSNFGRFVSERSAGGAGRG